MPFLNDWKYKIEDHEKDQWLELDGAVFGRKATGTQSNAYIAVEARKEIKKWKRTKRVSGYVKIQTAKAFNEKELNSFIDKNIEELSYARTDGGLDITAAQEDSFIALSQKVLGTDKEKQD